VAARLLRDYGRAAEQKDERHMPAELDGPRLAPKSGPARQLVVFLHGYGADGNDLIEIGRAWQTLMPHAAFVSPHAPRPCGQAPMGREWFPLASRDPDERWLGVNAAAPVLEQFLDVELARHHVAPGALALVGFSQGTMMALHVGLRRAVAPAAIVGYSGILLLAGDTDVEGYAPQVRARPPILLVHGDSDDLIPVQALTHTTQALAALEVPAEWHISAGLGHGIDDEGLRQGGDFLARRFRAAR
jgi:phospholipase/carboxylesterase